MMLNEKILVTGAAGFIGHAVSRYLLKNKKVKVLGLDNLNDYYDVQLKKDRLATLDQFENFEFIKLDLSDRAGVSELFESHMPTRVINLAAQAGVRYSIDNPHAYLDSNLLGFGNVLEGCRQAKVKHLVYASSSSVYGANTVMPFSESNHADHPLSLYAATKRCNELMAHSYSYLYNIPTTGLRFFTVYGPWGRPDMALFKFTKAILQDEPIQVYNYGKHNRDFTYIDDIVEGVVRITERPASSDPGWDGKVLPPNSSCAPWKVYNIGNSRPVLLEKYIECLEKLLGKKAKKDLLPLQAGDVPDTHADVRSLETDFNYSPKVSVEEGIAQFVDWYLSYYEHND